MVGQFVIGLLALAFLGFLLVLAGSATWAAFDAVWDRSSAVGGALLVIAIVIGGAGLLWSTTVADGGRECGTFLRPVGYPRDPFAATMCEESLRGILIWSVVGAVLAGWVAYYMRANSIEEEKHWRTRTDT